MKTDVISPGGEPPNAVQRDRESDDAVQELVESTVVDRAALLQRCVVALRIANIPLNLETADCLSELGSRMTVIIHEALGQTAEDDG